MKRLLLCLLLTACPEEKPKEHIATAVVTPKPEPKPDAGMVITKNIVPEPQPPAQAEVEMTGSLDVGKLKAARFVFIVAKSPCTAASTELEVLEQTDVNPGRVFTEMFFDQGTVANLCVVALDTKGQQVGFAAYAKNPVTFEGQGEVEVKGIELKLSSVKARAAPKGM